MKLEDKGLILEILGSRILVYIIKSTQLVFISNNCK